MEELVNEVREMLCGQSLVLPEKLTKEIYHMVPKMKISEQDFVHALEKELSVYKKREQK